jgi:hypothetical protein
LLYLGKLGLAKSQVLGGNLPKLKTIKFPYQMSKNMFSTIWKHFSYKKIQQKTTDPGMGGVI